MLYLSVADPGFPRGGGTNSPGGRQHTILPKIPKNCMKLKEFGPPGGGRASKILLCRSATAFNVTKNPNIWMHALQYVCNKYTCSGGSRIFPKGCANFQIGIIFQIKTFLKNSNDTNKCWETNFIERTISSVKRTEVI